MVKYAYPNVKGGIGMHRDSYKIYESRKFISKTILRITRRLVLNGKTISTEVQDLRLK